MKGLACFDYTLVFEQIVKPDQKQCYVLLAKLSCNQPKNAKRNQNKQSDTNNFVIA